MLVHLILFFFLENLLMRQYFYPDITLDSALLLKIPKIKSKTYKICASVKKKSQRKHNKTPILLCLPGPVCLYGYVHCFPYGHNIDLKQNAVVSS